jgi:hypothetical protein
VTASRKVYVQLSREAWDKAQREADIAEWCIAKWVAWLVEDYQPPEELGDDSEGLPANGR